MLEKDLDKFLYRNDLAERGAEIKWTPLAGGVSSDIWRVELADKTICVKRALANLKVKAVWRAPVERNIYEWEWFNFAYENFPEIVPRPIAHDRRMKMLAMEFLAPEDFTLWKKELLEGIADFAFAANAGKWLGKIHAKSANDENLKNTFATDDLFFALRIEPYLLATAEKHSDVSSKIKEIADRTLKTKIALVHGDVSPKNILKGKENPIFLDAETAWFGDPAFDLAFCLNHLLLKSAYRREFIKDYLKCFHNFADSYLERVVWESPENLEKRTANLLPVLLLARIDGKSPVEYLTQEAVKNKIRRFARKLLTRQYPTLKSLSLEWIREFQSI